MEEYNYDELVEMYQEGKLNLDEFILHTSFRDEYIQFKKANIGKDIDDLASLFLSNKEDYILDNFDYE